MTVLAAAAVDTATAPVEVRAPQRPGRTERPARATRRTGRPEARTARVPRQAGPVVELAPRHEHDWRLVQVDWTDGGCIKEFDCACGEVWFA
jgi:hypothetical protein